MWHVSACLLDRPIVGFNSLVCGPAALDAPFKPQIGHPFGVAGLVLAHLRPVANELLGTQAPVSRPRHHERRQVRGQLIPVDRGRDHVLSAVLVGQPLGRSLEELPLLVGACGLPPLRRGAHHVFDRQHRILAPLLRQPLPELAHRLIGRSGRQVIVVRCALLIGVRRLAVAVAVLQRSRHRAHAVELLRPHDRKRHPSPSALSDCCQPVEVRMCLRRATSLKCTH